MKYLKKTDTEAEYTAFVESVKYVEPNVTYVEGDGTIHYKPYDPILTFTALTAGSKVTLTESGSPSAIGLSISTNGGSAYSPYTIGTEVTLADVGDTVKFKATTTNSNFSQRRGGYYFFTMTGSVAASGDVTSLLNGTGGDCVLPTDCFYNLFNNCTVLMTPPNLPSTTLADACYLSMFQGCRSLVSAPALPATTLSSRCYGSMFTGCISLTTAPKLPATTLAYTCYTNMFNGCVSLTTAPKLPATTLLDGCYSAMFTGCTSLTAAPTLAATTLAEDCYSTMFYDCSSLNYVKAMFTTTPSETYTSSWLYGVSANGTFVKNTSASWDVTGVDGVPSGWRINTESA